MRCAVLWFGRQSHRAWGIEGTMYAWRIHQLCGEVGGEAGWRLTCTVLGGVKFVTALRRLHFPLAVSSGK